MNQVKRCERCNKKIEHGLYCIECGIEMAELERERE